MSGSLCHIKHSSNTDITVNKNVLSAFLHLYNCLVGSLVVFVFDCLFLFVGCFCYVCLFCCCFLFVLCCCCCFLFFVFVFCGEDNLFISI